ncbi:MAG: porin [Gemmatimonadota bacterium]
MRHRAGLPARVAAVSFAVMWMPALASPLSSQVRIDSRAMQLEVSGRLQFQLQSSSCGEGTPDVTSSCNAGAPELDMFLRRARLAVEATIDERLTLKLEPDFSDVDEIALKDAWGRYAFSTGLAVKAGHFNRPFDGFFLTSSSRLPFERAVVVPGVSGSALSSYSGLTKTAGLSDRDIGLTIEGTHGDGRLAWWLGVFNGDSESGAQDTNTPKQFIGRARVSLEAGGMPLDVTGAVAHSDAPYVGTTGDPEAEHYTNFELWAGLGAWGRDGLLVHAGVVAGDNPHFNALGQPIDLAAGDEFGDLVTWQAVAAYRISVPGTEAIEALSPLLRISHGDPTDAADDEVLAFTPGLALYFHGRNRLAMTWDLASFAADDVDAQNSFTAQMQFHF